MGNHYFLGERDRQRVNNVLRTVENSVHYVDSPEFDVPDAPDVYIIRAIDLENPDAEPEIPARVGATVGHCETACVFKIVDGVDVGTYDLEQVWLDDDEIEAYTIPVYNLATSSLPWDYYVAVREKNGDYIVQASSAGLKYFVMAEDAETSKAWVWCKRALFDIETGSVSLDPDNPDLFKMYYAEQELASPVYAKAGYKGLYTTNDKGNLIFLKGFGCIEGCQANGSSINLDLPDGEVDTEYSHTVTGTAIDTETIDVVDLPDGLTYDAMTNEITGTPTTAGVFHVVLIATAVNGCQITKIQDVTIAEAPV